MSDDYLTEPLSWNEGMLLSPQHFQQNDIYWHEQLAHRTRCLRPYAWGLWDLEIERQELRKGVLRVRRVQALLPDGLAARFPAQGGDDSLAPLHLDALDEADRDDLHGKGLTIHLAAPKRMRGAASGNSDLRRYVPVPGGTALDENTGLREIPLDRLRACLSLLPASKLTGGHEHIPLLRIERRGTEFGLSHYHPPLLRARAADFLGDDSILQRLDTLLLKIMERAQNQAADTAGQRITGALTRVFPSLFIMVKSGEIHPFDLYLQLAQLLGHIAQLSQAPVHKLVIEPYDHDDPEPDFATILERIDGVVAQVRTGMRSRDFREVEDGIFEIDLDPAWDPDALLVELRGADPRGMERWMRNAHIGDAAIHGDLQRRRLPGAGREPAAESLAKLTPTAQDGVLYALNNHWLPAEDGKTTAVIRKGGVLRIQGPRYGVQPHALALYFPAGGATGNPSAKNKSTPPAAAPTDSSPGGGRADGDRDG